MNQVQPKSKQTPTKGVVIVATGDYRFLTSAVNCCESILDVWPEANVCIFTEQRHIDSTDLSMFTDVIPTPSGWFREKMYGMINTPYDLTFYLDADIEIWHEDIKHVFDRLDDDTHMCWVELKGETKHHFVNWDWGNGPTDHLTHCGGVVLYDNRQPLVKEFMQDWYDLFWKTDKEGWLSPEMKEVPQGFHGWDQLTVWYMMWHYDKYKDLKWKFFDDNYRWNYYVTFGLIPKDVATNTYSYGVKDPVVIHYSSWMKKTADGFKLGE